MTGDSTREPLRPLPTRPRLYEQVARQIGDWMVENHVVPGDRLPPERELAQRLGVSRATVSQALVAMEVVGVVAVRHGDGAVVLSPGSTGLVDAIRAHSERLPDLGDMRDALESKLAALAAERRTTSDLKRIERALDAMRADVVSGGSGSAGAEQFQAEVTAAAHSPLVARMLAELRTETCAELLARPECPRKLLRQCEALLAAIQDGAAQEASVVMHDHLTEFAELRRGPEGAA